MGEITIQWNKMELLFGSLNEVFTTEVNSAVKFFALACI